MSTVPREVDHPFKPELTIEVRGGVHLITPPRQALESTKQVVNMHLRRAALEVLDFALDAEFQSFDTEEHQEKVAQLRSRMGREAG